MVNVGDQVEVASNKVGQLKRSGRVTGVSGTLLTVEWDSGGESTFAPGAGAVTVVGRAPAAKKPTAKKAAEKKAPAKKAGVNKGKEAKR
ncbi:MAG: DUF1918 domain-containing protein [Acidimicrobiia bacterium]